jgi:ABC-type multidrug transport system fused ATPase/permease subunit
VFDKATSSVDPYTEARIQETFRQDVRDMDRIILLEDGMIGDEGTHDQLLQRSRLFRELCKMQLVERASA